MNKDLLYIIMLDLSTVDIVSLCRVNTDYLSLCNEGYFWHDKMVHDHIPIVDNEFTLKRYETLSYLTNQAKLTLDHNYIFDLYNLPSSYTNNTVNITVRKLMNKFIISTDNTDQHIVVSYEEMLKIYVKYLLYNPLAIFKYGEKDSQFDYEYPSEEDSSDDIYDV